MESPHSQHPLEPPAKKPRVVPPHLILGHTKQSLDSLVEYFQQLYKVFNPQGMTSREVIQLYGHLSNREHLQDLIRDIRMYEIELERVHKRMTDVYNFSDVLEPFTRPFGFDYEIESVKIPDEEFNDYVTFKFEM